jgi:hypothetical protein
VTQDLAKEKINLLFAEFEKIIEELKERIELYKTAIKGSFSYVTSFR